MLRKFSYIIGTLFLTVSALAAEPASPTDTQSRISILVLPFEAYSAGDEKAPMADDYLMEAFARQKRFTIVEREKLDKLLLEQKLSRKKLTGTEQSVAAGRLLSADQMLYGRIEQIRGESVVGVKMVSTSTSETRNYTFTAPGSSARELRRMMDEIAARIAKDFPLIEGKVVRAGSDLVTADIAGPSLRTGLEVIIYRLGDEVKHPATGRSLGRKIVKVAGGTISAVEGGTSSIKLSMIEKGRNVKAGDLVVTR